MTVGFCQGACGSQNQACAPRPRSSSPVYELQPVVKSQALAGVSGQGREQADQVAHERL